MSLQLCYFFLDFETCLKYHNQNSQKVALHPLRCTCQPCFTSPKTANECIRQKRGFENLVVITVNVLTSTLFSYRYFWRSLMKNFTFKNSLRCTCQPCFTSPKTANECIRQKRGFENLVVITVNVLTSTLFSYRYFWRSLMKNFVFQKFDKYPWLMLLLVLVKKLC